MDAVLRRHDRVRVLGVAAEGGAPAVGERVHEEAREVQAAQLELAGHRGVADNI